MPIHVISGLPGSGKTTRVIEIVRSLRASSQPVALLVNSAAVEFSETSAVRRFGKISSRAGVTLEIDHLMDPEETQKFLADSTALPSTLVFDEAQYYGDTLIGEWSRLSKEGFKVVLSTPSQKQLNLLSKESITVEKLETQCALLQDGPASQFFVLPETNITLSVCEDCAAILLQRARESLSATLIAQEPHPGQARVYQPIDLNFPEFSSLAPIREDCAERVRIMTEYIRREIGEFPNRQRSYIDVGCNTGYFCKKMADLGFVSTGVDIVPGDIKVAKLLDAYFYRRYMNFACADALDFISACDSNFDVVSTFSVFQWIYIQKDKDLVDAALDKLFRSAKHLVFFEMGYTEEAHYKERLKETINREWCLRKLNESGYFGRVDMFETGEKGLKRDFFVGIRKS